MAEGAAGVDRDEEMTSLSPTYSQSNFSLINIFVTPSAINF